MNFNGLKKHVFELLEEKLPSNVYYHGLYHSKDVLSAVEKYIVEEEIADRKEQLLLKSAAVLLNSGFVIGYDQHEEKGLILAHEILPKYGYLREDIEVISGMILATKSPQSPQNHLEQILCDCDMDYLGRGDFEEVSQRLYKELSERGIVGNTEEFNRKQIELLESHSYYTGFAKRNRKEKKQKHLEDLKSRAQQN